MSGVPAELQSLAQGRYRVIRQLAQGGMGTVYEGFDERRRTRCAIKVLEHRADAGGPQVQRFKREAQIGAQLGEHPGIVAVYDSGALPTNQLYCVMEFVEGQPMNLAVQDMPRERAARLVAEVARAVAYAHERGIIHRDLKPQNVMVRSDGRPVLTDFGLAKALDDLEGLTATGAVMGTISFMPPEQIEDSKRVDERSDVYGLGGLLYVALTGREPRGLGQLPMRDALMRVLETKIKPPRAHAPDLDPALDAICLRALARNPNDRQQSAATFADELEAWLAGDRTVHRLPPEHGATTDPGWSDATYALVLGLALLVAASLVALALSG